MKKVAVFGKPANGKSTLSKQLAMATGLELFALDSILYKPDGQQISKERYEQLHEAIISGDQWIIEGFGHFKAMHSFYARMDAADTLIYIDLPYPVTYWLVTKRMLQGIVKKPEGWPTGSSILQGSINSYKTLRLCPKFWNDAFLQKLEHRAQNKTLHVIRSTRQLSQFVQDVVK